VFEEVRFLRAFEAKARSNGHHFRRFWYFAFDLLRHGSSACYQGDEERKRGIPVSPFMDRDNPQVAELQRTFINNLIKNIVVSMHKTGILAGAVPDDGGWC